uniref:Salivary lipocalin n=1 Tax=Triatoma dimidiata TaxID=72491 RepID=D1MWC2_TRIDM|nr:hypothetical protein Td17 similar to pallidipin 2 [Triatoma dimidiata]
MKMIIAVTFLGILMHVFAEKCELLPAVDKFDSDRYFSVLHLFVTHSKNEPKQQVCREYETRKKKNKDGTSSTRMLKVYKIGGKLHKTVLNCIKTPKRGSEGQFSVKCEVKVAKNVNIKNKVQLELSVIATDYRDYALLPICTEKKDNILVLQSHNKGIGHSGVQKYFKAKGRPLDQWNSRTTVNCDDVKN